MVADNPMNFFARTDSNEFLPFTYVVTGVIGSPHTLLLDLGHPLSGRKDVSR